MAVLAVCSQPRIKCAERTVGLMAMYKIFFINTGFCGDPDHLAPPFCIEQRVPQVIDHQRLDFVANKSRGPRFLSLVKNAFNKRGRERSNTCPRVQQADIAASILEQACQKSRYRRRCHELSKSRAAFWI